jgi:hypothetical protein
MNNNKLVLIAFFTYSIFLTAAASAQNKKVVGWVETVKVTNQRLRVKAKIDSGADQSSINAIKPHIVMRKGIQWVRFQIKNESGQKLNLERKLDSVIFIKKKDGGIQKRLVVNMEVCLGGKTRLEKVNLSNRSRFKHSMLIGRSFLGKEYLIDTGATHLIQSNCGSR